MTPPSTIDWPDIGSSPINECNTEGLFNIAFPTLFPNGDSFPHQALIKDISLDTYAMHLMRYHDKGFGSHPRFRHYLYNLIMRHKSQTTSNLFIKQSQEHNSLTTIEELRTHLQKIPIDNLPHHVMRFGAHLRSTRPFWTQRRSELTSMITQLQCPTLFFTLSVADTKWPDLHAVMQENIPSKLESLQQWRNRNIIGMPHIVAAYKTFSIFREEMLQKKMHTTDYW